MISVIIPVYNSAPYLKQCLNSVLSQTYPNLEVICVDDGSTDTSKHIIQKIVEKDPRVILVSQPNSGVSTARNAGLDIARGEYITFLDSDDEIEPDMYETLLDLLLRYKADIAHCGYKKMYLDGTVKDVLGTGELLVQNSSEASQCLITGQHFVGSLCTKLYKQELFSKIRCVPELKINEDVLVNAQLFNRAQKIVFYDVAKYHYFERSGSSCTRTDTIKKKQDCVLAAEYILELHKNSSLESVAATKLYYALSDLYRSLLFSGISDSNADRQKVASKIRQIALLCNNLSLRSWLNYTFMHSSPRIYTFVYKIYDRIRKPNWDL